MSYFSENFLQIIVDKINNALNEAISNLSKKIEENQSISKVILNSF